MKDDIKTIENQIFYELKDSKDNYNYMCRKYEGSGVNFEKLHKRILNYQYKTYGCSLREGRKGNKR